jgi:hypothetical protein
MTLLTDEDGDPVRRAPNGDLVPDISAEAEHTAICRDGWQGDDDNPTPCPRCRPHLTGPHAAAARTMSERDLQARVRAMCGQLGVLVEHVEDSRRGRTWLPGIPDLTIIGRTVIYRELKTETGIVSPEQRTVGEALARAGADWGVWRPRHLLDGTIARTLAALRGPQRHADGTKPHSTPDHASRAFTTATTRPARRAGRIIIPD